MRLAPLVFLLALILLLATACREEEKQVPERTYRGQARPFAMGISSLPPSPDEESYRAAFRLAADAGEVILIQRAPPWSDFLPGASISDRTGDLTRLEKELARTNRLRLFLAVDPTDPADRGQLASLPDALRGRDFADAQVRTAFIAYAKYLALNYKPDYLALGVEVDMFFARRGDAAFRNFQSLYFEAYDAVKEASPNTLVFPTFQYEDMLGILQAGVQTLPAWSLVNRFEPKIDMLAVSSFPSLITAPTGIVGVTADNYYDSLTKRINKPLALVSAGWSTLPAAGGATPAAEEEQAAYVRRTLTEAETLGVKLVVWYLGRDTLIGPSAEFEPLAHMGFFRSDGLAKGAWGVWQSWLARPPPRPQ